MHTLLVWFRQDLRVDDNPALNAALRSARQSGARILPVYIHDDHTRPEDQRLGGASRWWLHHALSTLGEQLNQRLILRQGDPLKELQSLIAKTGAGQLFWNRLYDPWSIQRDQHIKQRLRSDGIEVASFNSALLFEPWTIKTGKQTPFRVFTPFWKHCLKQSTPAQADTTRRAQLFQHLRSPDGESSVDLQDLDLKPTIHWYQGLADSWDPSESGAWAELERFLDTAGRYQVQRDYPAQAATSRLSPYLHFGQIGPRQIHRACIHHGLERDHPFLRELYWREFSHHLMFHFPHTLSEAMDDRYNAFPWEWADPASPDLHAWCHGQTGIPIVDAGMRELWETGWMHNRVRMLVASLLSKNLNIHWRVGQAWFHDTLVDADLAQNALGWQWTAGCGADAAPFFRIFNPVLQSRKFDADGEYLRRWCPELARLPTKWIHAPWEAPTEILKAARVELGKDYPRPIVDLGDSRKNALARFSDIKNPPSGHSPHTP